MQLVHSQPASSGCPQCLQEDSVVEFGERLHCGRCNLAFTGTEPRARAAHPARRTSHLRVVDSPVDDGGQEG